MNLSLLSLECVIPHLDANKRILLSICYTSFRKFEKCIAIELDRLEIEPSVIIINDKQYKVGEIHDIRQIENITEKNRERIRKNNSKGGVGWMSRKDAVLESGDVTCRHWDETFLEVEKYELMQSVRRMFMSALERFYDSESQYNPLRDLMNGEYLFKVFDRIERESEEKLVKICIGEIMILDMNPVKLEQDELSILYPKAFKTITDSIETIKHSRDDEMVDILTKLVYPQMIYPHFNQFTVFNRTSQDYHNRLPDGLSLRQAFKQFSTVLFGRRNKIHVRNFALGGKGIIPLPVGFQIERLDHLIGMDEELMNVYNSTVKYVYRMFIAFVNEKCFRLPIVQKCRILEVDDTCIPLCIFRNLPNEVLILKMPRQSRLSPLEFFNEWLKNENRKIGSKFIIAFDARNITPFFREENISEIGFRKTARSSSYYRPLSGGKKAVLHVDKEISRRILQKLDLVWSLHWDYDLLDFCYCVEIVGSE